MLRLTRPLVRSVRRTLKCPPSVKKPLSLSNQSFIALLKSMGCPEPQCAGSKALTPPIPRIRLAITDVAGSCDDEGFMAGIWAFVEAFKGYGIEISWNDARAETGLNKREHIAAIFARENVKARWKELHNREPSEADINDVHSAFLELLPCGLMLYGKTMPGFPETMHGTIYNHRLMWAACSGYRRKDMNDALDRLKTDHGLAFHATVAADEVKRGRPHPDMIEKLMDMTGVKDPNEVLYFADGIPDMKQGRAAAVWTCALVGSGNGMCYQPGEVGKLNPDEYARRYSRARNEFQRAGAHLTVKDITWAPLVIADVNRRLMAGERAA